MKRRPTARARLDRIFARDPHAWTKYSLSDLARRIGVSRQRVAQLLPDYAAGRHRRAIAWQLERFVKRHPRALRTPANGGIPLEAIAKALRTSERRVAEAWRALALPERVRPEPLPPRERSRLFYARHRKRRLQQMRRWRERNPDRVREIGRAADRRYRAKLLRRERCVFCGRRFDWTQAHENRHRQRGTRVVCSAACGGLAWRREQADDRRRRPPGRTRTHRRAQT